MATPTGSLVLVTRLSRAVYRYISEDTIGMRFKDYMALRHLVHEPGISQQELSVAMHLDANNTVILLNELEHRGWAHRLRDPADRRRHRVDLTDAGREALAEADRAVNGLETELLHSLTAAERKTLHGLLDRALKDLPNPTPSD